MSLTQKDPNHILRSEHDEKLDAKRVSIVSGSVNLTSNNIDVVNAVNNLGEIIKEMNVKYENTIKTLSNNSPTVDNVPIIVKETVVQTIEVPIIVKETVVQTIEVPQIIIQKEIVTVQNGSVNQILEVLPLWAKIVMGSQLLITLILLAAKLVK